MPRFGQLCRRSDPTSTRHQLSSGTRALLDPAGISGIMAEAGGIRCGLIVVDKDQTAEADPLLRRARRRPDAHVGLTAS
jgi:hypothetical protein